MSGKVYTMELFNKIRRILRGGKALPNEHGPLFIKRDDEGRWIPEKPEVPASVTIKIVPATTSDKPDCVCGHGTCRCAENKKAYAEALAEKINKASATKPTKLEKVKADAEAMKAKGQVHKPVVKKAPSKKKPKSE